MRRSQPPTPTTTTTTTVPPTVTTQPPPFVEPPVELDDGQEGGSLGQVSHFLRQHHALVLYAFGAFILVRMWFFAFAKKDSKLISFCAFVMLVALYLWWSRRRSQLAARAFPDLPTTVVEGNTNNVQLQRQDGGVTREGKEQFVRFNYEGPSMSMMMATPVKASSTKPTGTNSPPCAVSYSKGAEEEEDKMEAAEAGAKEAEATEEKTEAVLAAPSPVAATRVESDATTAFTTTTSTTPLPTTAAVLAPSPALPKGDCKVLDVVEPLTYVDQQCSICLCEYEHGDELCMLPCYHAFHDDCISVWVTNHSKCPLCLRDLNDTSSASSASGNHHQIEVDIAQ